MKRLIVGNGSMASMLGVAFAVLLHLLATPAYSSQQIASLTEFSGTVIVQSRGDWGVKPEKGLALYSMDKVVTRTGTAVVTFNDGAVIEIRANSNLLIEEQEKTGSITRNVRLLLGKVLFKTGKGSSTQTNLQTPTAIAGLRGTAGTLSIGVDGQPYIHFTQGGSSFTVGDFISGVAKDVPPELADLNPAQRAAFVAAAAADQAKNAAEAAKDGKIADPQAALAAAKAAEAAGLEAKAAAETMLNNPDPAVRQQAQTAIDAANKAIDAAKDAQQKAIDQGAKPGGPDTYTEPKEDSKKIGFDKKVEEVVVTTTFNTTTTTTSTTTTPSTTSAAPTTTIAFSGQVSGSLHYFNDSYLNFNKSASASGLSEGTDLLSGKPAHISITGSLESSPPSRPMLLYGSGWYFDGGSTEGEATNGTGKFKGYTVGTWRDGLIDAEVAALYIDSSGKAGYLSGNPKGSYSESENYTWKIDGDLTAHEKGSTSLKPEDLPSSLNLIQDRFHELQSGSQTGHGDFWDSGELIGSLSVYTAVGDPLRINDPVFEQRWGIWNAAFGGSYGGEGTSADWKVDTGGYYDNGGYEDYEGHGGYWIGHITGTKWGENEVDDIRGSYEAKALTETHLITFDGDVLGSHWSNEGGYWHAAGIGTYTLEPLAWSGEYKSGRIVDKNGEQARMSGIIGGLDTALATLPPGDSARFTAMGDYEGPRDGTALWSSKIRSRGTDEDKGLFGFTAGIVKNGTSYREMDGAMVAIFDVENNVGLLTSYNPDDISISPFLRYRNAPLPDGNPGSVQYGVSGGLYSFNEDYGMWEMSGSLLNDPNPFLGETEYNTDSIKRKTKSYSAAPIAGSSFNLTVDDGHLEKTYFKVDEGEDRGRFGVYDLKLEGTGSRGDESDPWFTGAKIVNHNERTVAKALMFGSFDGDEMKGVLFGLKKKTDEGGEVWFDMIFKGPVFGLYDSDEGTWIGESIGTWKKYVLRTEGDSLFYNNGGSIAKWARDPGLVDITLNQSGEHNFLAVGEYFETVPGAYSGPTIQATRMSGDLVGPRFEAFEGLMSGTWKDGSIDGMASAIYLSSDGSAGLLTGELAGLYADTGDGEGMWVAEGPLNAIEIATGLNLTPEQFHSSIFVDTSTKTPSIRGRFLTDDDVEYGKIKLTDRAWKSLSIEGQDWGISSVKYAGTYEGSPSDRWAWETDFSEKGIKKFESVTGSKWSEGVISGQHTGAWVNWEKAVTGVMGGQLKGTFNPTDATWQAVSQGAYLETGQFMDMIARGQVDALQKLNIPCVEIGKTTLAGSSNLLNVKMNDVTFFAYSSGANPKIWATNNVTGTYSGTPLPGHNVSLQSISGGNLNANFSVNNWANKNWGASVAGSGALKRTDVGGTANVNFQGAAAGTYGNGNLTGTGSGVASPK